jgi:hypothetical protein
MITAWANDPGDEHRLLSRTLMVLYRYHALPEEFQSNQMMDQDFEILLKVAQYDQRDVRRDIWSMLDNEMRPILDLTVTLAIEPYTEWTVPLVRSTEMGFGAGLGPNGIDGAVQVTDRFYTVGGTVYGASESRHLSIQLLELAVPVTVSPNGRYSIRNLREGTYTVEVWTGEGEATQHRIDVPSPQSEYDIYL